MRQAGRRVKEAIKRLMKIALVPEEHGDRLLEKLAADLSTVAQGLLETQQWGNERVRALA